MCTGSIVEAGNQAGNK